MPDQLNSPQDPSDNRETPSGNRDFGILVWAILFMLFCSWMFRDTLFQGQTRKIPYSQFKLHLEAGDVQECKIRETEIIGTLVAAPSTSVASSDAEPYESREVASDPAADDPSTFQFSTVRVEDPGLVTQLEEKGVRYTGVNPGIGFDQVISWLILFAVLLMLYRFFSMRLSSARGMMSIGSSKAKMVADRETNVDFDDVAGCDEAKYELQEVVDFLQNPDRYTHLGAKIPKGVLLVGPPGTGKTLLARAVAGEAKVPFYSLSGSDFVEMFVGVGAARVRDLFVQAAKDTPCIVFIDELDAIGRQRGIHPGAVNDEREHTLNQLLVEMDGFEANVGVILLAATNRPDILDRALLRPGRFDRQVVLDAPDRTGRQSILEVHARNKPLEENVNLGTVASATPGFSGADLANVMNEAALLSARKKSPTISQTTIEEAIEKVIAGPERKSRRLEKDERIPVAYHEVGHALVGVFSNRADPVHKISIIPRGHAALGYTLQLPTGDHYLTTKEELQDRMKGLMGGRAAEELVFGEISTGAENDLKKATLLAQQMVCMYGMSERVGLAHVAHQNQVSNDHMPGIGKQFECSPATAEKIDLEVKTLLDEAYREATKILTDHRDDLDRIAKHLLESETIDADQLQRLLNPVETPSDLMDIA